MSLKEWYINAKSNNFLFEISKRNISTHFIINKFGENTGITATKQTIWDVSSLYNYIVTPVSLSISCNNAADTFAGTGAQTVKIFGLNENFISVSESINLAGLTPVLTVNKYSRIFRMVVTKAGTGGTSASNIYAGTGTVTAGVPALIHARIQPGNNQTLMAVYTIPANYTGYIVDFSAAVGTGKDATLSIVTRAFNSNVFNVKHDIILAASYMSREFKSPFTISEKSDIEVRGVTATPSAVGTASFDIIVVKNNNSVPDIAL